MPGGVRQTRVKPSYQRTLGRVHTEAFRAMREFFDNARAIGFNWNAKHVWVTLGPREWELKARAAL